MIEVGTILQNRYRIDKQIGQGGMGKVYVASDERFNSTVAIKETVFEDKSLRRAFEREARLLNSLKHLALPRVSDHFIEDEGQFLVMEYIAGEDLAEMMERSGEAFPLKDVLNWAGQLCDALKYLHAQDIIHRDIKPQNLKLTPKGQIVLLDFGLAKGNPTDSNLTAAKSIFGYSRSYASLEQIQGTGTEPRSDLYSLGATIYHLLTGIPPADALTRAMNVLNGQPDPLIPANLINDNVPAGIAEVLQKTMALNANERPISTTSLARMLEEKGKDVGLETSNKAFKIPSPDFLMQETKIKTGETNSPIENQATILTGNLTNDTPFKTHLVGDENESIVTKVKPLAEITNAPRGKGKAIGATVAGLLLVGGAVSAAYFYSPVNSTPSETNSNSLIKNELIISTPDVSTIANTNTNENASVTIAKEANTKPQTRESTAKASETAQQGRQPETRKQSAKQTGNKADDGDDEDKSDTDEDVKIDGKTIEGKDYIIDDKGVRLKRKTGQGQNPYVYIPIPGANVKVFSPEDLRQLEEFRKMKMKKVIVKPPKPTETP